MKLPINQMDDSVRFTPNIPNALSTVYTVKVPESLIYTLFALTPLKMKLLKSNGQEISRNTKVVISAKRPGQIEATQLAVGLYASWADLSPQEQNDTNMNSAIRLDVPRGRLDLIELHELLIRLEGPDVVDGDLSHFILEIDQQDFRP